MILCTFHTNQFSISVNSDIFLALFSAHIILVTFLCCAQSLSRVQLCDPVDCIPPSYSCLWGFSRQDYWSGLSCPPPGDLLHPGIKPRFSPLQADSLLSEPPGKRSSSWSSNKTNILLFYNLCTCSFLYLEHSSLDCYILISSVYFGLSLNVIQRREWQPTPVFVHHREYFYDQSI